MPTDAPAPRAPEPPPIAPGRVRGTLASQIALVTTAVTLLTALIVAAVSVPQIRAAGQAEARANLGRTADAVISSLDRFGGGPRLPPRVALQLQSGEVQLDVVEAGDPLSPWLSSDEVAELSASREVSADSETELGAVIVEARALPDGTVLVFTEPKGAGSEFAARDTTRLLLALGVAVAAAAAAGLLLARRLARPLRTAAAAAEQMALGRRDVDIVPAGPQEVAEVAESLNDLNAALTTSEARQREFLLSVSHELRTPLTSLRGYAEAFADGVVPEEQAEETGRLMASEASRLERIVADLLDLARMGARDVAIDIVSTDAVPLLTETAAVWSDRCRREGIDWRAELPSQPVVVRTDPGRFRQIVDNLLGNALRVTPPGRPIVLAARDDGDSLTVEVRDGGPGLSDDDLLVAFEPAELYSRYRGLRPVGTGVGLALVGRLAQRLGGTVTAGHAPEGGACFTLVIPLARQSSIGSDA